jgi:hypothetical protein
MRVTFESGNWVEMRSPAELMSGDRSAMHAATEIPVSSKQLNAASKGDNSILGDITFSMGMVEDQQYAVLSRLISAWSYDFPIPRLDETTTPTGKPAFEDSLRQIPIDDWDEIDAAVAPHMAKLRKGPKGKATSSSNGSSRGRAPSFPKD